MPRQPEHTRTVSLHLCFGLGNVIKHQCICFIYDGSRWNALRLAYPIPAMAHDEQSLAAIAANAAAASRAWVRERLGRADFELSCVCPFVRACMHVLACAALYLLMPVRTTIDF